MYEYAADKGGFIVMLKGRNFLTLLDYSPEEIRYLLDLAKDFKEKKHNGVSHCLL